MTTQWSSWSVALDPFVGVDQARYNMFEKGPHRAIEATANKISIGATFSSFKYPGEGVATSRCSSAVGAPSAHHQTQGWPLAICNLPRWHHMGKIIYSPIVCEMLPYDKNANVSYHIHWNTRTNRKWSARCSILITPWNHTTALPSG